MVVVAEEEGLGEEGEVGEEEVVLVEEEVVGVVVALDHHNSWDMKISPLHLRELPSLWLQ